MVRCPSAWVSALRDNPLRAGYFDVLAVGQGQKDDVVDWVDEFNMDRSMEQVTALYTALARSCLATHAIVSQPLFWYSTTAAAALRAAGVRVFYAEAFYDKVILDEVGAQYTADNEIRRHEDDAHVYPVLADKRTRYPQTPDTYRDKLWDAYGDPDEVIALYGQVPGDMALQDRSGGLSYRNWIRAIVEENPDKTILFKEHPLAFSPVELPWPNVRRTNANVFAMFRAYPYAAAYSSTVILEGTPLGVKFATGGHHFLSGLTYRVQSEHDAKDLVLKLHANPVDPVRLARRRAFIEYHYTYNLAAPAAIDRLTVKPELLRHFYQTRIQKHGKGA